MKKTVSLTKQGKADLETELKELIGRRPAIAERLQTARAFGDLSENQEYTDARSEQKTVENRIAEIEEILKNVWEENYYGSDRVVDDTLRRLRKKLPNLNIHTIYGYGYRLG